MRSARGMRRQQQWQWPGRQSSVASGRRRAGPARLPRPAGGAACRFARPGRARSGTFAGRRQQWLAGWRPARAVILIDRAGPGTRRAPQGPARRPFGPGCPRCKPHLRPACRAGGGLNQRKWHPCRDARTGRVAERMQGGHARLLVRYRDAPVRLMRRPNPPCPANGADGSDCGGPGHAARPDSGPMSAPLVSWTWMPPNCASLPATSASAASVVQITDAPASRASA